MISKILKLLGVSLIRHKISQLNWNVIRKEFKVKNGALPICLKHDFIWSPHTNPLPKPGHCTH